MEILAIHIIIILIANQPLDRVEYDSSRYGSGTGCVWSKMGDKFKVNIDIGRVEFDRSEIKLRGKCG